MNEIQAGDLVRFPYVLIDPLKATARLVEHVGVVTAVRPNDFVEVLALKIGTSPGVGWFPYVSPCHIRASAVSPIRNPEDEKVAGDEAKPEADPIDGVLAEVRALACDMEDDTVPFDDDADEYWTARDSEREIVDHAAILSEKTDEFDSRERMLKAAALAVAAVEWNDRNPE